MATASVAICMAVLLLLSLGGTPIVHAIAISSGGPELANSSVNYPSVQTLASLCPGLPTAKELLANAAEYSVAIVGGRVNSTTTIPNFGQIRNYTSDTVNFGSGAINLNQPNIVESNGTTWVQVPLAVLEEDGCANALGYNASPLTAASQWALGEYSQPSSISGSYSVGGVMSYGDPVGIWSPNPSNCVSAAGLGCYLGYDVLTMEDNIYFYQIVYVDSTSGPSCSGRSVEIEQEVVSTGASTNTQYCPSIPGGYSSESMKIAPTGTYWDFYFNGQLLYQKALVSGENPYILTSDQPTSVVETNDFTQSDFRGFVEYTGDWNPMGTFDPAVSYFFNGGWNPSYTGPPYTGSIAHAYVYWGGYQGNGWAFGVATSSPPSWSGVSSPNTEEMVLCSSYGGGCTVPPPSLGTQLW